MNNVSNFMDPNGAHYPILATLLANTSGPVLELGTGNYSTPLIYFMCPDRFCISVDNDKEWFDFYRSKFAGRFHYFIHTDLISEKLSSHILTCHQFKDIVWDVAFVDHSPAEDRVKCIELLRNKAKYIIAHDSEHGAVVYNWGNIWDTFKHKFYWEFFGRNGTTIVSDEPIPVRENYSDIPPPPNGQIENINVDMPKVSIDDFITGEKFEAACDIDCEKDENWQQTITDKTDKVLTVFCQTHELKNAISYLKTCNNKKFIVVSHNSDGAIEYNPVRWDSFEWNIIYRCESDNIKEWFGQNVDIDEEKVCPIPIGMENTYVFKPHIKLERIIRLNNENIPKINKMLICFHRYTNCEQRCTAYNMFKDLDWVTCQEGTNGIQDIVPYFDSMIKHRFVLCPDGNGIDTVRMWEALYMGCVPIVFRHVFTEYFTRYLPIIVIDSLSEINPGMLSEQLKQMRERTYNYDMLKMSYWEKRIAKTKELACESLSQ